MGKKLFFNKLILNTKNQYIRHIIKILTHFKNQIVMLKSMKDLGQSLTKEQQRQIKGGFAPTPCNTNGDCWNSHPYLGPGDVSCRYSSWNYRKMCQLN